MKNGFLYIFIAILLILLKSVNGVYAGDELGKEEIFQEEFVDLNGDEQKEKVKLTGIPHKNISGLYKKIQIQIDYPTQQIDQIKIGDGFYSSFSFIDVDNDHGKELLVKTVPNNRNHIAEYYLYSFKGKEKHRLEIPELPSIHAEFKDNYEALLKIDSVRSYTFDLNKHKNLYNQLGLYQNGKLNEPTELIISPYIRLEPTHFHHRNAIKGTQRVNGISVSDSIAYIETYWVYEKEKWVLEKVIVKEIVQKNK